MTTTGPTLVGLDNTFRAELSELGVDWQPASVPQPHLLVFNDALARGLGLDPARLTADDGVAMLVGNAVPEGVTPIAMAYAGHQFGGYSPRLGDGRALLLGEVVDGDGTRWDLHLKGSGRTPFARGGDGKAALGPMLREFVMAEAMHALGVPTTRALAVVATGEGIMRDQGVVPGAVLARVAASHIRVGTFEYAARLDPALVHRLADYAIARHHPQAVDADRPYLAFLEAVVETQAALVARWMLLGFIHGVMNTDNMTISGETIDYGPCAFLDAFDPATVYSSIDQGGRYAYGNQPIIAQWNLSRLAETLLPLIDANIGANTDAAIEAATAVLRGFTERYSAHWQAGMAIKLGLSTDGAVDDDRGDSELIDDYLALLRTHRIDYTGSFRALSAILRADTGSGDGAGAGTDTGGGHADLPASLAAADGFGPWAARWRARLAARRESPAEIAEAMDAVNPIYVPRNHLVEEALEAAGTGDLEPFGALMAVLAEPFRERPGLERYALPAPDAFTQGYRTFCGT